MKEIHSKHEIVIFENKAAKTIIFIEFWRIIIDFFNVELQIYFTGIPKTLIHLLLQLLQQDC